MNVYFDNAASTMVRDEVAETVNRVMLSDYGNPSSMHGHGRRASAVLEEARGHIANALGAQPENICFTSGGTESCSLAILGAAHAFRHKKGHIITSAIEHDAVRAPVKKLEEEGFEVTYLPPGNDGRISAAGFAGALRDDTVFASIMLVNNETGAVNPVGDYTAEIRRRGLNTVFHTDAVQGFCKLPFSAKSLGADLISVSAHKIHGIKGAGALYISSRVKLKTQIPGGAQESGRRGGTEPLPAIAGFGEAARLGIPELETAADKIQKLRGYTAGLLKTEIPDVYIIGEGDFPYILCLSLPGFKSEVLTTYLDSEGISVSKGAACKKGARSHVLEAMRLPANIIDGALRVSFSRHSTRDEADYFIKTLKRAAQTLLH